MTKCNRMQYGKYIRHVFFHCVNAKLTCCRCKTEEYFRYWHRTTALKGSMQNECSAEVAPYIWICNVVKSA